MSWYDALTGGFNKSLRNLVKQSMDGSITQAGKKELAERVMGMSPKAREEFMIHGRMSTTEQDHFKLKISPKIGYNPMDGKQKFNLFMKDLPWFLPDFLTGYA